MSLRGMTAIPITRFEYQSPERSSPTISVGIRSGRSSATWALCCACCWAAPGALNAQENGGWIGKRVVQTRHDLALKSDERAEGRPQNEIHVYRVERIEGRLLWLEPEGAHVAGWARCSRRRASREGRRVLHERDRRPAATTRSRF